MYGLTDASLMWFKRVKKFVGENSETSSITDPALFMRHHNDKLIGVMTVHVDDFLCAGLDLFYLNIISNSRQPRYLDLNIESEKIHIAIDQNNYIEQLKKVDINPLFKFKKKKKNFT